MIPFGFPGGRVADFLAEVADQGMTVTETWIYRDGLSPSVSLHAVPPGWVKA